MTAGPRCPGNLGPLWLCPVGGQLKSAASCVPAPATWGSRCPERGCLLPRACAPSIAQLQEHTAPIDAELGPRLFSPTCMPLGLHRAPSWTTPCPPECGLSLTSLLVLDLIVNHQTTSSRPSPPWESPSGPPPPQPIHHKPGDTGAVSSLSLLPQPGPGGCPRTPGRSLAP